MRVLTNMLWPKKLEIQKRKIGWTVKEPGKKQPRHSVMELSQTHRKNRANKWCAFSPQTLAREYKEQSYLDKNHNRSRNLETSFYVAERQSDFLDRTLSICP
jgi:hypothetical protein